MFWNKYFWPSFIFLIVVAALHWIASYEGFYWTLDWYDVMMHGFGGLWVVVFTLWAVSTQYGNWSRRYVTIINMLVWVLVVGILWEIHEIVLGFTNLDIPGAWDDTFQDIILDMMGASIGVFACRKSIREFANQTSQ